MADCRRGGVKTCQASAATGCSYWMRETGVDDDNWAPAPRAPSKAVFPILTGEELRAIDLGGLGAAREILAARGQ